MAATRFRCGASGNALDLWVAVTKLPVYEAALALCERLRLDVASRSDVLRSDVSHGYVQFDLPAPPYFSRNTLHYGPDTYLELCQVTAGADRR